MLASSAARRHQQILNIGGKRAPTITAEDVTDFVVSRRGVCVHERSQDQRLSEIELYFVGMEMYSRVDIVGPFLGVIAELGMPIDLARRRVEIGLILRPCATDSRIRTPSCTSEKLTASCHLRVF